MLNKLAPRERQIVDLLYTLREATVTGVRDALPDALTDSAVRAMLIRLLAKGYVTRRSTAKGYFYAPAVAEAEATSSALKQVVKTFFDGSPARAASALLGMTDKLSDEEARELRALISRTSDAKQQP
jgi:predicted transcriptional regulator